MQVKFATGCFFLALLGLSFGAPSSSILNILAGTPRFSWFTAYVNQTPGLAKLLTNAGKLTVFVPNNDAFAKWTPWMAGYFNSSSHIDNQNALAQYHVVQGVVNFATLTPNTELNTLEGAPITVAPVPGTTTLGLQDAVTGVNCGSVVGFLGDPIQATNGVVQEIGTVLQAPALVCPDTLFWVEQRENAEIAYLSYECRAVPQVTYISKAEDMPIGIAIDTSEGVVFWANSDSSYASYILRANTDGTNKVTVVDNLVHPQGIDVDRKARKLYYTEIDASRISRANYDGSDAELVWQGELTVQAPSDVAVDPVAGLVFATLEDTGGGGSMNGSLIMFPINSTSTNATVILRNLINPYSLCLDTYAQHLYYVQGGNGGGILCYQYGTKPCEASSGTVIMGMDYPNFCTVDNAFAPFGGPTKILFTQSGTSIVSVNSDGSDPTTLYNDWQNLMGLDLACIVEG